MCKAQSTVGEQSPNALDDRAMTATSLDHIIDSFGDGACATAAETQGMMMVGPSLAQGGYRCGHRHPVAGASSSGAPRGHACIQWVAMLSEVALLVVQGNVLCRDTGTQ